jgi:ubiquinone/menaquinone biosynthesis C-methylase UbiE
MAVTDLEVVKTRQQAAWSSGDYAVVGTTLQIVGEQLCESLDLRPGAEVLDVAAGNGNASLAAARRWAVVTSTDYVPELLERGRERASAERLEITFRTADAENLPFADNRFDVVVSTFGVMFTADHDRAAAELLRVCRPGGKIGLASWTPDGFIGEMFKILGRYIAPPPGTRPPPQWGMPERIAEMFGARGDIQAARRVFNFRYRSPEHWLHIFRSYYGPTLKAFAALPVATQAALEEDLLANVRQFNHAGDGTMLVPSDYLEAIIIPR